ncbi:hypothetical protein BH11PLA2_BH11PLA2_24300 [soil metagenome]
MPFPGLSGKLLYHSLFVPYFSTFTLGWSLRVKGREHLPKSGPILLLSNHQSFLDPPLLGMATYPRPLTFLARKELFKNALFRRMIDYCGAVPIDQSFGRDGIRAITERLHNGETVAVFPEGERTLDGSMMPLKPGVSLLLRDGDFPIVPVGIAGAFEAWPRGQKLPHFGLLFLPANNKALSVVFGEAILPEVYREWERPRLMAELTLRIRNLQFEAESIRRVPRTSSRDAKRSNETITVINEPAFQPIHASSAQAR